MKWYEKQKKLYTQNQEEQKNTPFGDRASIRGNDAVDHAALSAAVQESLKSQNEQLQTGKNDEAESFKSKETTVIQEHTTLQGDMNTEDNITIHGVFIGNISCGGDLTISGSVKGNISCKNAVIQQAKIEGDIVCDTHLEISQGSCVHGNVNAKQILCGGQIIGDTESRGNPSFWHPLRFPVTFRRSVWRWNAAPCCREIFRYKLPVLRNHDPAHNR